MLADDAAAVAAESVGNLDACGYGSVVDRPGSGEIEASACQLDDAVPVASPAPASAAGRRRRDRLSAPAETPGSEPDHRLHPLTPGSSAGDEDAGDEGIEVRGRTREALREGVEVLAVGSECGLVTSGPGAGDGGAGGCCEG